MVGGKGLIGAESRYLPIHIPCRLSAFLVSTSCIFAGSTARTGVLSRTGIVTRTKRGALEVSDIAPQNRAVSKGGRFAKNRLKNSRARPKAIPLHFFLFSLLADPLLVVVLMKAEARADINTVVLPAQSCT